MPGTPEDFPAFIPAPTSGVYFTTALIILFFNRQSINIAAQITVTVMLGIRTASFVPDVSIYPIDQLNICTSPTARIIMTSDTIPKDALVSSRISQIKFSPLLWISSFDFPHLQRYGSPRVSFRIRLPSARPGQAR